MIFADEAFETLKVLIIDDDPMVRDSLELLFSHHGWQVDCLVNGDEVLSRYPPGRYQLAVVDHKMDGLSGIEIVRQLKANYEAPIFMLTGCVDPEIRDKARAAGADRFFAKPTPAAELIEAFSRMN